MCRSTLAAEACAADEGAEGLIFANMCLGELLFVELTHKSGQKLNGLHVTDAKSVYGSVCSKNPSLAEKRPLVNIRSIQETVSPSQVRWVPTGLMKADSVTKLDF